MNKAELILETIRSRVGTALDGVTIPAQFGTFAGGAGAYIPETGTAWIQSAGQTVNANLSCCGSPPKIAYDFMVVIRYLYQLPDTNTDWIDAKLASNAAQVMDRIARNGSWWEMDGHAINSNWLGVEQFDPPDNTMRAVAVMLKVTYRVDETNQIS